MPERRVVVTGLGIVSALGPNAAEFWLNALAGRSGIAPIEAIDCSMLRFRNGAEVRGYDPLRHFSEKHLSLLDRFAQFALLSAREAHADSGVSLPPERTAIVTGSCVGGQCSMDEEFVAVYKNGMPRVNPMTIPRVMANSGASQISMELGITGPVYSVSTACASATHAIGQAFWMVRNGIVDAAIAGGSEAVFSYGFLRSWEAMRVVSPDTCRPFSRDRKGLILGEGGAMLVLETLDSARRRGARIYAEVAGFGMSSDAHHITQPSASGAARAMRAALEDAGMSAAGVGHINAHGTGTPANDVTESGAIREVAPGAAVTSTKSLHGHSLGAAGAMEAVSTVLALAHDVLPPTANFNEADPQCCIDLVTTARQVKVTGALSNSFAFGGLNAVLAFRRFE